MNINDIMTLINTCGFPIACCGAMGWYITKVTNKLDETIQRNTLIVEKLVMRLESEKHEDERD